jgi:hypothetical protein
MITKIFTNSPTKINNGKNGNPSKTTSQMNTSYSTISTKSYKKY